MIIYQVPQYLHKTNILECIGMFIHLKIFFFLKLFNSFSKHQMIKNYEEIDRKQKHIQKLS